MKLYVNMTVKELHKALAKETAKQAEARRDNGRIGAHQNIDKVANLRTALLARGEQINLFKRF